MNLRIPISQNCYNSAKRKAKDSKGKLPLALGAIGVHIFLKKYLSFPVYYQKNDCSQLKNKNQNQNEKNLGWILQVIVLSSSEKKIKIPPNLPSNLLGYMVVEVDEKTSIVTILGFLQPSQIKILSNSTEDLKVHFSQFTDTLYQFLNLIYNSDVAIAAQNDQDKEFKEYVRQFKQQTCQEAKLITYLIQGVQNSPNLYNSTDLKCEERLYNQAIHQVFSSLSLSIQKWGKLDNFITLFNAELEETLRKLMQNSVFINGSGMKETQIKSKTQSQVQEWQIFNKIFSSADIPELDNIPSNKYPWVTNRLLFYLRGIYGSIPQVANRLYIKNAQNIYTWRDRNKGGYKNAEETIKNLAEDWLENKQFYYEKSADLDQWSQQLNQQLALLFQYVVEISYSQIKISNSEKTMREKFDEKPDNEKYPQVNYRHLIYLNIKGESLKEIQETLGLNSETNETIKKWLHVHFDALYQLLCKCYPKPSEEVAQVLKFQQEQYHQYVSQLEKEIADIHDEDFEIENE